MSFLDDIDPITENLYISSYWPRLNFKKIRRAGITAIVNLMETKIYTPPKKAYDYLFQGFPDNTYPSHDKIKKILDFIDFHIKEKKGKVLVHCAMGLSRSGGLVTGWLLKENPKWSWGEAMEYVKERHIIMPAVEIRESVLDYLENLEGKRRLY
ncbi:MAG: dual specificity protein phosphatase family protein [Promethearchaeota archaeon]